MKPTEQNVVRGEMTASLLSMRPPQYTPSSHRTENQKVLRKGICRMFQSTKSERKKFLHERNRLWVDDKLKTLILKEVFFENWIHTRYAKRKKRYEGFKEPQFVNLLCDLTSWCSKSEELYLKISLSASNESGRRRENINFNRDLSWTWYDMKELWDE